MATNSATTIQNVAKELKKAVLLHGKFVIDFLKIEDIFIKQLNELHKLLSSLLMKKVSSKFSDGVQQLSEIIVIHQKLYEAVIEGKYSLSSAARYLPSHFKQFATLSNLVQSSLCDLQQMTEESDADELFYHHLLFEPVELISRYEEIFQSLCDALPENRHYRGILTHLKNTADEIKESSVLQKNLLCILKIQRLLIDRQPKILSSSRKLLKEGHLFLVSSGQNKLKKRAIFLFNDFLLCCKIVEEFLEWPAKDSLKCCAVLPLKDCSVNFSSGYHSDKGNVFKLKCQNVSYLLLSKVTGESSSWIQAIRAAIRNCRASSDEWRSGIGVIRRNKKSKLSNLKDVLSPCK